MKTVIEMAQEADFEVTYEYQDGDLEWGGSTKAIERFAELVRADEREACAKLCDRKAEVMAITGKSCDPDDLAAAIRARGNT